MTVLIQLTKGGYKVIEGQKKWNINFQIIP